MICRPKYANLSGPEVYVVKEVTPKKTLKNLQTYLVSVPKIDRVLTPFWVTLIDSPITFTVLYSAQRNPGPQDQIAGKEWLIIQMLTLGTSVVWYKPKEK